MSVQLLNVATHRVSDLCKRGTILSVVKSNLVINRVSIDKAHSYHLLSFHFVVYICHMSFSSPYHHYLDKTDLYYCL